MTVATIVAWAALAATQQTGIDIMASLHGYNLLWPSSQCCAFTLHVAESGDATVEANISTGRSSKKYVRHFTLTPKQLSDVRHVIDEVAFFELPESLCCGPLDGEARTISITEGEKKHQVVFENESKPEDTDKLERIQKLWSTIIATFKIPGANVK